MKRESEHISAHVLRRQLDTRLRRLLWYELRNLESSAWPAIQAERQMERD